MSPTREISVTRSPGGGVGVGLGVAVEVGVGVGVPATPVSTISCGAFADSRLPRLRAVVWEVVSARLTTPLPATSDVTSSSYQFPLRTGPEESVTVDDTAGALL